VAQTNRQILLATRPEGAGVEPENFRLFEGPIPSIREGEVLVRNLYASIDPAMRGWIRPVRTYVEPVEIGAVMRAITVGKVISSKSDGITPGQYVTGMLGMQDFAVAPATALSVADPLIAPLEAYCGGLGMTGQTAYFGMTEVGRPRAGETVLVSSAAGATGSVAGQLAKVAGCRVVGIAGGKEKCDLLTAKLGFDAAIDYKEGDLADSIRAACPDGIDLFFDNVGGDTLDAALLNLRGRARIVLCGAISQANGSSGGPKNLLQLAFHHATMEGFIVYEYVDRFPEATEKLGALLRSGDLVLIDQVEAGIERFPELLNRVFSGDKTGKLVLQIGEDD
jgi:NADPH-dependent curcumin reductase CurA